MEITGSLPDLLQKIEQEVTIPNLIYEASIALIPKSDRISRKNYRPVSPLNLDIKTLKNIPANHI